LCPSCDNNKKYDNKKNVASNVHILHGPKYAHFFAPFFCTKNVHILLDLEKIEKYAHFLGEKMCIFAKIIT
tara:strand:+ start:1000 stop:1212 length:213 start_codon:yes stop_codon:yes gene_type:complete